jgi:two-component system OmpR family sensor kinase
VRLRAVLEATLGRRLLIRIWLHGVLLFAGVAVAVITARIVMPEIDEAHMLRMSPHLALAVGDRALAAHHDPGELAREVAAIEAGTPLSISIYSASGALLASSVTPPLPAPNAAECTASCGRAPHWRARRLIVGAPDACAILAVPPPPTVVWHLVALLGSALVLAFVFVAAPLTYSIARPVERLGALARELGAGNLAVRVNSQRHDELGDLGRSFDAMASQIQRLRTAERQLLGDVSHELRTPLARIRVLLELASAADPERVRTYLGEVATDLGELERLIDDIIMSARLDATATPWSEARPPLHIAPIAIDEPITAAVDRFRARCPERAIVCPPADASLMVDGDSAMLRRVLDNLLDNARKYSSDDQPIEVLVQPDDATERPAVRVEVIDRGIGIARDDLDRVFSAFFRVDRSRARSSGGVGLGLALARRIVEAHGGRIGVDSALDRGSRFWFSLPLTSGPTGTPGLTLVAERGT